DLADDLTWDADRKVHQRSAAHGKNRFMVREIPDQRRAIHRHIRLTRVTHPRHDRSLPEGLAAGRRVDSRVVAEYSPGLGKIGVVDKHGHITMAHALSK